MQLVVYYHLIELLVSTCPVQRLEVRSNDSIQPVAYFRNTGTGPGFTVRTDSDAAGKEILSLFSGSSYKFWFGRDGKLGIGTINPSDKLEVNGNVKVDKGSAPGRTAYLSDDGLYIGRLNTYGGGYPNSVIADPSNSNNLDINARSRISLKLNTNTVLVANDSGNVGIGTTSPASKLHVTGDIRQQGSSYSVNIAGGTSINGDNHLDIAANGSYLNLRSPNNSIFYRANSDHAFRDAGGSNEYLRIKTSGTTAGNVGIGTTSPSQKLEVAGNVKLDGDNRHIYFGGNNTFIGERSNSTELELRGGGNSPAQTVYIDNTGNVGIGNSNPTKNLEIGTNAAAETEFRMHSDESGRYFNIQSAGNFTSVKTTGSQNFILDSSGSAGYITMVTNASERMRINYNGNVGIGTTIPSEKLDVRGNVYRNINSEYNP